MSKGNVVIIGSGRSGRGYIGELCYLEDYAITFADIDRDLVKKLKDKKQFTSFKDKGNGEFEEIIVKGFNTVHVIDDYEAYQKALTEADFIFTATFNDAFDKIITDIQECIDNRVKNKVKRQVCLILGANYVGLYDYFDKAINERFNEVQLTYFKNYVVMVESVIYRISSFPSSEQYVKDNLSIQNENYNILRVNKKQISLYEEKKLPDFFFLEEDTLRYMHLKIWKGNTMHCSLAFLGNYYGKECICDSANDDYISKQAYYAYEEAFKGLAKEYNLLKDDDVKGFWEYYRDVNFKDSNLRVGNDPIRKLARNDRFIGPALLCMKNGITPVHICQNAAYGFYFKNNKDERNIKMMKLIQEKGIEKTIEEICQLDLSNRNEKIIFDLILAKYYDLQKSNPVDKLLWN